MTALAKKGRSVHLEVNFALVIDRDVVALCNASAITVGLFVLMALLRHCRPPHFLSLEADR
jgi:hypothetical protein